MKLKTALLVLSASFGLGIAANAAYPISFSGTWSASLSNDVTGTGTTLSQNSTTTITNYVTVPLLDITTLSPGWYVTGVTIEYSSPYNASPTVGVSTSVSSGSSTFSSLSASIATHISSTDVATMLSADFPYDILFSSPYTNSENSVGAPPSLVVSVGSPWDTTLTRNYDVFRLNTPTNGTVGTDLTTVGPGSAIFTVDTLLTSQFTRDAVGGDVAATFTGTDSGTITITYQTIPEPGAALLGSIGVLFLLRRRSR